MPSAVTAFLNDDETVTYVASVAADAFKHGLQHEWFDGFLGSLIAGVEPKQAALDAALEWDF